MDLGKILKSIAEPSRGGIGTRLNTAKAKFTTIIEEIIKKKPDGISAFAVKRRIIPKKTAKQRFAKTPAEATAMVPHFLLPKLLGL